MLGSSSSYTYRDWALEYNSTEESTLWQAERLNDAESNELFGVKDLFVSMTSTDQQQNEDSGTLHRFMVDRDDFFMEPLLACPDECIESICKLIPSKTSDETPVPVCASVYGVKNLVFRLANCVLCVDDLRQAVYIPSSFINKIKVDVSFRDMNCSSPINRKGMPFHPGLVMPSATSVAKSVFESSTKRKVTKDHIPMYDDNYTRYVMVEAVVHVALLANRSTVESQYGNDPITFHGKREIQVYVLSLSHQQKISRNDVADSTSDGDSR
jgi:hypothetical protein